jgi:hypothetical protein
MARKRNPRPNNDRPDKPTLPSSATNVLARACEESRRRMKVVKTTRTPAGQIIDWVPIESQVAKGKIATPPPTPKTMREVADSNHRAALFEMSGANIERGPAGTVPLLRRDFSHLTERGEGRVRERKRKVDGRRLTPHPSRPPFAAPDPFGYYHATSSEYATCYGCQATLNVWAPTCEFSGDHSISQFGIQNYDNPKLESLEAGWEVSRDQYNDDQPHLFTYYTTNGYDTDADNQGGYNRDFAGWVQYDANIFPGALINGVSIPGGVQDVIMIKFQLWQGNWWFQVQGIWLGYYPASLFQGKAKSGTTLGDHGSWIAFWGEVYSSLTDPTGTTTDMGSGRFAEEGWTRAAFQSNTLVQSDRQGTMVDSNGGTSAEDSTYYDIENHMESGSSWGSYFWFGGPGYQPPRWTLPLIPGEVVRIIIGGADGTLITIDASGHIHIIPQPGPDPYDLFRSGQRQRQELARG